MGISHKNERSSTWVKVEKSYEVQRRPIGDKYGREREIFLWMRERERFSRVLLIASDWMTRIWRFLENETRIGHDFFAYFYRLVQVLLFRTRFSSSIPSFIIPWFPFLILNRYAFLSLFGKWVGPSFCCSNPKLLIWFWSMNGILPLMGGHGQRLNSRGILTSKGLFGWTETHWNVPHGIIKLSKAVRLPVPVVNADIPLE